MKALVRYLLVFTIGLLIGLLIMGACQDDKLPTIEEIQRLIGCETIDGKVSPDWRHSETQKKWERALCNQFAMEYFKGE